MVWNEWVFYRLQGLAVQKAHLKLSLWYSAQALQAAHSSSFCPLNIHVLKADKKKWQTENVSCATHLQTTKRQKKNE